MCPINITSAVTGKQEYLIFKFFSHILKETGNIHLYLYVYIHIHKYTFICIKSKTFL